MNALEAELQRDLEGINQAIEGDRNPYAASAHGNGRLAPRDELLIALSKIRLKFSDAEARGHLSPGQIKFYREVLREWAERDNKKVRETPNGAGIH